VIPSHILASVQLVAVGSAQAQAKPQCRTFKEIYGNEANVPGGKKLCEKMWSSAFKVDMYACVQADGQPQTLERACRM